MYFAGAYDLDTRPDLARLPRNGSRDWRELAREVLAHYGDGHGAIPSARFRVVHPDDKEANALIAYLRSGEFVSDDVAEPRVVEHAWRGMIFTLLEEPRPLGVSLVYD